MMLQANELRIGNYVLGRHLSCSLKTPVRVAAISDVSVEFIELKKIGFLPVSINDCEPCPITEEWLLKLGFWYDEIFEYYMDVSEKVRAEKDSTNRWEMLFQKIHLQINVDYLHQLQNLYFDLTGEELTIKESV